MYYSLSLFLIFYRSSGKVKHKKIIRLRNDRNITESSWLHAYGTTPTKHLHLVCLFNYLVLVFFWSSDPSHLLGDTLIQVRILAFYGHFAFLCSNASIVLSLITSLFKLYGRESKLETTLRQKTFVAWNFSGFAAEIRKINTNEKVFKNSLVDKQCNKNVFLFFAFLELRW